MEKGSHQAAKPQRDGAGVCALKHLPSRQQASERQLISVASRNLQQAERRDAATSPRLPRPHIIAPTCHTPSWRQALP